MGQDMALALQTFCQVVGRLPADLSVGIIEIGQDLLFGPFLLTEAQPADDLFKQCHPAVPPHRLPVQQEPFFNLGELVRPVAAKGSEIVAIA